MSLPLDFFSYRKGVLTSEGVSLEAIAEAVGTPAYVYSAEAFLSPLRELQTRLKAIDPLICFAVKANSNLAVLKLLTDAGAGLDLVSGGELFRAGVLGIPGRRIVFSGVGKTPGEMARALDYDGEGIFAFNVESVGELRLLEQVAAAEERTAEVAIRFNPDVDAKTHPYVSTGLKKNKFGIHRAEILEIARAIKDYPHLRLKGLSIHIGSQLLTLTPLEDAFKRLGELAIEVQSLTGTPIESLDLGGGVGVGYRPETRSVPSIQGYCKLILRYFGPKAPLRKKLPKARILLEPGRMLAANAGVLLTEVLYRKKRFSKHFVIVDAAMNDLIRPALYQSHHEIVPVLKLPKGKAAKIATDIVGPVCETGDCFAQGRPLEEGTDTGDLLAILSAGAYGFTMASNYNSRPRPPEVLIEKGRFRVIREREEYGDLLRGEMPPESP